MCTVCIGNTLLITWPWWQRRLAFPSSTDRNNLKDTTWKSTTPRTLHRQQTKIKTQFSCEKGLFTYPGTSAREIGSRSATHLEATEVLPGNMNRKTPSLCTPQGLLQLNKAFQKETCAIKSSPNSCNYLPGTPPDFLVWKPARIITVAHRPMCICTR